MLAFIDVRSMEGSGVLHATGSRSSHLWSSFCILDMKISSSCLGFLDYAFPFHNLCVKHIFDVLFSPKLLIDDTVSENVSGMVMYD